MVPDRFVHISSPRFRRAAVAPSTRVHTGWSIAAVVLVVVSVVRCLDVLHRYVCFYLVPWFVLQEGAHVAAITLASPWCVAGNVLCFNV